MENISVYQSKNQNIFWNSEKEYINSVWISDENISEIEHRLEMDNYFDIILNYKPKFILADGLNSNRPISVEMQEWIAEIHFSKYTEVGVRKLAILMSRNVATSLSIVQSVEEYDENLVKWETKYFYEMNLALDWLGL